ncbi:hypothetical protein ACSE3M_04695 [Bacillus velezensis]
MNAILIVSHAAYIYSAHRLSAMLLIRAVFPGSGADIKKACGGNEKELYKTALFFTNHAV